MGLEQYLTKDHVCSTLHESLMQTSSSHPMLYFLFPKDSHFCYFGHVKSILHYGLNSITVEESYFFYAALSALEIFSHFLPNLRTCWSRYSLTNYLLQPCESLAHHYPRMNSAFCSSYLLGKAILALNLWVRCSLYHLDQGAYVPLVVNKS